MEGKQDILSLSSEEVQQAVQALGQPHYRAQQILQWLHRGVKSFDEMTDLPKALRELLAERFYIVNLRMLDKRTSRAGDATKYLFLLEDGNTIESVVMRYNYGNSLCLSTQVGCRMGCKFCASTIGGLVRNLSAGEMLAQVIEVNSDLENSGERRVGNIVLMGIGEPLDNYDNTVKFIKMVHYPQGLNMSYRRITLSTCGLVPKMMDLAEEGLPITLSVSLHAPNDELRKLIMPVASAYSIDEIFKASRYYFKKTGRRVTFEYALISDLNDRERDAIELARKLRGFPCHVNIIPLNVVRGVGYKRSSPAVVERFVSVLKSQGIAVTKRRELGLDIEGACGQLRRSYIKQAEVER
ncbi:23S rRNA (adenine2503-C2)-methyltransferase [Caldicoprobacter guelmensis]|uniref:23S rRNA (adenine(2503)-C(2))-methyltransferase RlmN n=1 Tax=Caldicoprobacter guelmensis TaxID=1170224 RepID=UPI00195DA7BD|nr:23S rRNA (adenine(2503)-C(2))-methyltransferase RlmN [Caldicoprobacter guelmensis]MBM7581899.1 23S rRNA (adenine2503-C2)-methyltransferase [Caldicoprobacter guelmensis]